MATSTGIELYNTVINKALLIPGVGVNRNSFLKDALKDFCTAEEIEVALTHSPSHVLSSAQLDRIVTSTINANRYMVTAGSAALGLPGNPVMAGAAGVADMAQYISFCLRVAQQIAYLNGYPELRNQEGRLDDYAISVITPMLGVMFGAEMANKAIHEVAKRVAVEVSKRIPRIAASRIVGYGMIKEVAKWLGVRMSKQLFARGLSKFLPVVGGLISGAISYAAFGSAAVRLAATLKEDRALFQQSSSVW